jgi:selenoprotein W-related protein
MPLYSQGSVASAGTVDDFATDLGEMALIPGKGGIFEIRLDGEVLFSRKREGHFPEAKEVKQKIRDRVAPGKDLGHSDR